MSKDPAFLFYPSDFLTGTMFLSNEQVGAYIRLLCAQHQQGHLPQRAMEMMCGGIDEEVFSKFEQDEKGLYYNKRLDNESERRTNYVQSRRKNLACEKKEPDISHMDSHMGAHMAPHMESHMESHMENRNENENIDKTKSKRTLFIPPTVEEVSAYCQERHNIVNASVFVDFYASKNWMVGKNKMKDWKASVRTWEHNKRDSVGTSTQKQNFAGVEYTEEQLSHYEDDPNELLARYKEGRG